MNALAQLQTSIEQASNVPGGNPDPVTVQSTLGNASNARVSVKQVAQNFRVDQEGHLEAMVQKLMEDPITQAEGLLRGMGPKELNGKGGGLCAQFNPILNKFPFNPASAADASIGEVDQLLKPGTGALWAFYEQNLKNSLPKQGNMYVPNPSGGVNLNPAFVSFFNTAARLSEALYKSGAEAHMTYSITPLKSEGVTNVQLTIDGATLSAPAGGGPAKQFAWPGAGPHNAKLSAKVGENNPSVSFDGLWSAFRLFNSADRFDPSGSGYNMDFNLSVTFAKQSVQNQQAAKFFLDLNGVPAFFRKGQGLHCVATVAR
jgi:type VI secretion system protein ImpL